MFNTEGEFLLKFGSNGEGNGQFNAPTGVAVDANGNIVVADWGNSRIQVGKGFIMSYLSRGFQTGVSDSQRSMSCSLRVLKIKYN